VSVRILHTADMHLGRPFTYLGSKAQERRQDLVDTFKRICDEALTREVAALFVAGDLFDTFNPPSDVVGMVQGQFDRLTHAGIRVYVIPGNHDDVRYPNSIWSGARFPQITLFREARFTSSSFSAEGIEFHVHGVAYNHVTDAHPELALERSGDGVHLAMIHATVDPPEHFPDQQRYFPLSQNALWAMKMDYIAMGHIHRQRNFRAANGAMASYPGSPEGLDLTEDDLRYVTLLEFDGGQPRLELIPVNGRTIVRGNVDVTGGMDDEIAERIRQHLRQNDLFSLCLTGVPEVVPEIEGLRKRLEDGCFWLELRDTTRVVDASFIAATAKEQTIRGYFVQTLLDRMKEQDADRETLELALRLTLTEMSVA
jgi:DNA repair protein SbcD/Mre11